MERNVVKKPVETVEKPIETETETPRTEIKGVRKLRADLYGRMLIITSPPHEDEPTGTSEVMLTDLVVL